MSGLLIKVYPFLISFLIIIILTTLLCPPSRTNDALMTVLLVMTLLLGAAVDISNVMINQTNAQLQIFKQLAAFPKGPCNRWVIKVHADTCTQTRAQTRAHAYAHANTHALANNGHTTAHTHARTHARTCTPLHHALVWDGVTL